MKIEIRGDQVYLDGYVNVVSRDSRILPSPRGRFIEQIKPKVFERALQNTDDVELLFNHQRDRKLGSVKDGNLELYEDNVGLRAKCTVMDHEVIDKAKNGELRGWSFGFITHSDSWEDGKDGIQRRFIEELDLSVRSYNCLKRAGINTVLELTNKTEEIKCRSGYSAALANRIGESIMFVCEMKEKLKSTIARLEL